VVWRWNSDPFGVAAAQENGLGYNLRFPGQYFDTETGTHYNYFRDYNAVTARYQQGDPIGLLGGANLYRYASESPLDSADTSGLTRLSKGARAAAKAENKKFNCGRCEWCGVKLQPTQPPMKGYLGILMR
jgi:RHS repeat-associated protein